MKNNKSKTLSVAIAMGFMVLTAYAIGYFFGGDTEFSTDKLNEATTPTDIITNITQNDNVPQIEMKPAPDNLDDGYDTVSIYEKVIPSVVCINVYGGDPLLADASGTGIIMTEDGYIITNAHVIEGGTSVNVVLNDGRQLRGVIVGADSRTDLAVIKISASGLACAEFGDSSSLKIGERAVVIGNAGGLSGSCTTGIISGLDRNMDSSRRSLSLIQTSRAINPGNSGGPLLNRWGQVVGITSSKIASVDYEGIGFAIPISSAIPIIEDIIQNGYVTGRAALGISVVELNTSNGPESGLPSYGSCIAAINPGSNMARAGVRERDVIIEANGRKVVTNDDLLEELEKFAPGDVINLGIFRPETEETFYVNVLLIEAK